MIEYIFFDNTLRDRFVSYVSQNEVPCTATDDPLGLVVAIPEDLSEELSDAIESFYDTLEAEQEVLSRAEGDLNRLAGFRFNLPDGQSRLLPVEPEIANRLMASFSLQEIQNLLEDTALCALTENNEHLCKILAERKNMTKC